jgi:hypothetical protein
MCAYLYKHTYVYIHTDHACMHPFIGKYIRTYSRACVHTCVHAYKDTYKELVKTFIHTYIHTCIYIYTHTYMHTYIRSYIHTYAHTYIHTYIRSYVRSYIHTYIHTYTNQRTCSACEGHVERVRMVAVCVYYEMGGAHPDLILASSRHVANLVIFSRMHMYVYDVYVCVSVNMCVYASWFDICIV